MKTTNNEAINTTKSILGGLAGLVAMPVGVAATAVSGVAGIVFDTVGAVFTQPIVSVPVVAVEDTVETVSRTISAISLTPIAVSKAVETGDVSKLHAVATNMSFSSSITDPYDEVLK